MNLYRVTYENDTLYFLAEDKDHLLTLVSQLIYSYDYSNLINKLDIERVAGNNHADSFHFYAGLFNDGRFGPV